jgi:IPT/TIG domain-containing protein
MRFLVAVLTLFLATSLSAQNVGFDPPNPTTRTPVTAHIFGSFSPCTPTVAPNGMNFTITLNNCTLPFSGPVVDLPVDLGLVPAGVHGVVLGLPGIAIGLGGGTLVVQDAAPPFQVTPNVSANADDAITITGQGFSNNPVVNFGGLTATVISATPKQIVVHAPQHDPGIVDVSVNGVRSIAAFYFVARDTTVPNAAFFERIQFPVAFSGPGALGSQWVTQIYLRNENDYPLTVLPLSVFTPACAIIQPIFQCGVAVPSHTTTTTLINTSNGFLVFVARQGAPGVHFSVLVKDLSRQAEALGTEVPVVREKDFFGRSLELLNIPTDPRFRVALRVYGDNGDGIALTIQPLESDDKLVSDFVFLADHPGYAQISDLVAKYPQLAGRGPLRITLAPAVAGNPTLWAFASVTNNETQHVTTISPQ